MRRPPEELWPWAPLEESALTDPRLLDVASETGMSEWDIRGRWVSLRLAALERGSEFLSRDQALCASGRRGDVIASFIAHNLCDHVDSETIRIANLELALGWMRECQRRRPGEWRSATARQLEREILQNGPQSLRDSRHTPSHPRPLHASEQADVCSETRGAPSPPDLAPKTQHGPAGELLECDIGGVDSRIQVELRLADLLMHSVAHRAPASRVARMAPDRRRALVRRWARELRAWHRDGGVSWQGIRNTVLYVHRHEHWGRVVLGPQHLRQHWSEICASRAAGRGAVVRRSAEVR